MVYVDVADEHYDEFNRWYDEEHIPERLSIPSVLNAARYGAVRGGPKYLACYEIDTPETRHSDAWQHHPINPTEWSQRMSTGVTGVNYVRNLYRLLYPADVPEETANSEMAPRRCWWAGWKVRRGWTMRLTLPTMRNDCRCITAFRAT